MADSTQPRELGNAEAEKKAMARERNRRYRERHPEAGRRYYLANRDAILEKCKQYRQRTRDEKRSRDAAYYQANRKKLSDRSKSPVGRAIQQRYRQAHKDALRERHRQWRENNRQHLREYKKQRRAKHPHLRLINRIRCRTWGALKTAKARKSQKTLELVGCTAAKLAAWIESQFTDGMCWEKIGQIHIDHVIPLSRFDLSDADQQRAAFSYKNLRPMWELDNKRKSDKMPGQHLFGFAYAATIGLVDTPGRARHRRNGTRQHGDDKRRSVQRAVGRTRSNTDAV